MRSNFFRFFAFCLVFFLSSTLNAIAQNDDALSAAAGDKYVISAKAGHVNYTEGAVGVVRKAGKSGILLKGDKLAIGDRASTGADGKAEILLNPGSFLRLGGLSAFEFETTSLDDLRLRIDSGSAILEVFATDEFKVSIKTPRETYTLVATGIYRIDIPERGDTRLEVWKGTAQVGSPEQLVKSGRAATTGATRNTTVAKFDRDEKDELDIWSKGRGKELTRMTAGLRRVNLRSGLMGVWGTEWSIYGSFGLWVYNPFYGRYCFLPFGHAWSSPYGYGYNHCIHNYDLPHIVYNSPPLPSTNGGSTQIPTPTPIITPIAVAGDRSTVPPFVRMQQSMGGGRVMMDHGGSTYDSGHSSPSHSPSVRDSAPTKSDASSAPMTKSEVSAPLTKQP